MRFSQNMVFNQKNGNNFDSARPKINIFFLFWRSRKDETFYQPVFWNSRPGLRKVKFTIVGSPFLCFFRDMFTKIFIKNQWYTISKFCLIKRCVLTWALIWNHPELYTSSWNGVIKILLETKNHLWVRCKSGLVRPSELKFLPEV